MIEENQELKRKLAARGMWTLTTATSYVEGHNNTWVVNNILNVPRFHKFLQDTVVSYPPPGKKGYLFHPKPWLDFLDKWFSEISRSLREKGK
jgi:phage pi2 protein 07